jgi:hypothetical protein
MQAIQKFADTFCNEENCLKEFDKKINNKEIRNALMY